MIRTSTGVTQGQRRHGRRFAVAVASLAMVAGSLLSAAPGAVAAGDPVQTADVAKGQRRTDVLAASGSVIIARAQETASAGFTRWSTDGGANWEPWDGDWGFTPTTAAAYVANGKAVWIHTVKTGDSTVPAVTVIDLAGLGAPAAVETTSLGGRDKPQAATDTQVVVGRDGYKLVELATPASGVPIRLDSLTTPKGNTYAKAGWVLRSSGLLFTTAWSKKANGRIGYIDIDPVAPGGGFGPKPIRVSGYVPYVNVYWTTDGSDGLATIEYLRLSGSKLTWCTQEWNTTTTDALKKASCKKVATTKKSATISAVRYGPAMLGITINGALKLWNGSKLVSVAKVSGYSLAFTGLGDPAEPLVRAEKAPEGAIYAAATNGKLTTLFDYFIGRVSPVSLDLTHTQLAGMDGRATYRAWTRAVDDEIAPAVDESIVSGTTAGWQVSGSRSAQRIGSKLTLRDGDAVTGTASSVSALSDASGPYSLITRSKKTYVLNSSGAVVAKPSKSGNQILAIFGSLAVEQSKDRKSILVRELSGQRGFPVPAAQIPGASAGQRISSIFVWGDQVVVDTSYSGFHTAYVYNWHLRDWTASAKDVVPVAIGDGVAAVFDTSNGMYALWDLDKDYDRSEAGTRPFEDADTSVPPSFDGVGRFVYSTGTALKLVDLSQWDGVDLSGKSAARVLGTVAPTSYEINLTWKLAVDASRPLADGKVEILDGTGTVVAEVETEDGEDGSVRIEWNGAKLGEDGDAPEELVPDGTYTWRLDIEGTDGKPLTRIDGDPEPLTGTIKVTTATIKSSTPKISGTAAVGKTLTATHSWSPVGLAYTYRWLAGGVEIGGATDKTFKPTVDQAGKAITVEVTATNRRGDVATKTSKATKKVTRGTVTAVTPIVDGILQVDKTLTAVTGDWAPVETTFSYQWFKVDNKGKAKAIPGAQAETYLLAATDVGFRIMVTVKGEAEAYGYNPASKSSKPTATKVIPSPPIPDPDPDAPDPDEP